MSYRKHENATVDPLNDVWREAIAALPEGRLVHYLGDEWVFVPFADVDDPGYMPPVFAALNIRARASDDHKQGK